MTDVIVLNAVEFAAPTASVPGQVEYVSGSAVLCYDTLQNYSDVAVASSGDVSGFPYTNALNFFTHNQWKPSSTTGTLTFTGSVGHAVDYIGIGVHNLFAVAGTVTVQTSDDGSKWTT